ncbi:MAG TPA: T9SS type A sorting domain-containing protein [Bacteroidales bacterium]|nr:T9SS type A sorting domain-containing protein [Bacteroidales bacterium]
MINFDIPECPNSTKIFEINYNTLNIFPNPADDFIDLKFSNEIKNINNINILDVSGKIVDIIELDFCNNNNSLKKDISRLSEGIYYISINSDSKTEIFRFIKLQTP